jgi:class 3 adenylate cyclase
MDREEWRRPTTGVERDPSRVLLTMLFTDLVGSTELAASLGDRRWRDLLERHHASVRELLQRFRGREVDCAGDGFFATFDTATEAVRCGSSLTSSLWALGLRVRVGLHTGECERFGERVSGVAVHAAARLSRLARPLEVLVTSTVKDVVAGSGLRFQDRGSHELRGLPGRWQLFSAMGSVAPDRDVHVVHRQPRSTRRTPLHTGRAWPNG